MISIGVQVHTRFEERIVLQLHYRADIPYDQE